ncbi:MAG TPA: Cache 3/Cache 2 fusion domain-containing protein [Gemmatimonadales bacterium]|nr:Cache 3/Cache 2 fusion domain-containing protein [Gemmatimonadales bacterium]
MLFALLLACSSALVAFARAGTRARATVQGAQLEASIFSFDGHDFTRTNTTLMTEEGKSAVDTKLDHNSPAYKALMRKRSYSGEATVFGHKYDANYAPLTDGGGKLTGALFVAVPK